jgi:hypothetical protein
MEITAMEKSRAKDLPLVMAIQDSSMVANTL